MANAALQGALASVGHLLSEQLGGLTQRVDALEAAPPAPQQVFDAAIQAAVQAAQAMFQPLQQQLQQTVQGALLPVQAQLQVVHATQAQQQQQLEQAVQAAVGPAVQAAVQPLQEEMQQMRQTLQQIQVASTNTHRRMLNMRHASRPLAPIHWLQNDAGQEVQGAPPTRTAIDALRAHEPVNNLLEFYGLPQMADDATVSEKAHVVLLHIGVTM